MSKSALLTLIGLQARIVASSDQTLKGISGKVILETRNTLTISTGEDTKVVPKQIAEFEFSSDTKTWKIAGSSIIGTPAERLAKVA